MTDTKDLHERLSEIELRLYEAQGAASALTYLSDFDNCATGEWRHAVDGLANLINAEMGRLHKDLQDCVMSLCRDPMP